MTGSCGCNVLQYTRRTLSIAVLILVPALALVVFGPDLFAVDTTSASASELTANAFSPGSQQASLPVKQIRTSSPEENVDIQLSTWEDTANRRSQRNPSITTLKTGKTSPTGRRTR